MTGSEITPLEDDRADTTESATSQQTDIDDLIGRISSQSFERWYRERKRRENFHQGKPHYNQPSPVPDPRRHSPSSLLQCHRKIYYRQLNAPREEAEPAGIFWIGSQFEEEFVLPYLEALTDEYYVANSLWLDFTVQTDDHEFRIRGETDPVIVDEDGTPVLLTEVKTKKSVEGITSPNQHHKAQAHSYMYGLSQEHDRKITDAVIIYGSRTSFDIRSFHIEFDVWFWSQTVLNWAKSHTEYRLQEELPPADPAYDWECSVCSFRHRCGRSDAPFEDIDALGFLPLFTEYPEQQITEYLDAHADAVLTPTLAHQYPELAEKYEVANWRCRVCGSTYAWDAVDWDCNPERPPSCAECVAEGLGGTLIGPMPEQQLGHNPDLAAQ